MSVKTLTTDSKKIYRQIRTLCFLHDIALASIARKLNVSTAAVTRVIKGQSQSHRIKMAIAEALNMDFKKLWGHEYRPRKEA